MTMVQRGSVVVEIKWIEVVQEEGFHVFIWMVKRGEEW